VSVRVLRGQARESHPPAALCGESAPTHCYRSQGVWCVATAMALFGLGHRTAQQRPLRVGVVVHWITLLLDSDLIR
jgi:hypothetical protein